MDIPKKYDPKASEPKWQAFWEDEQVFAFDPKSKAEVYSIDTPPPYASADHLHVGHGMSYTQFEFVARYKRMRGFNVFFPMGWDDNGLPTERFVEKKHNVDKSTISRSDFIKLCIEETQRVGKTYKHLWTEMGLSMDWNLLYTTIGPTAQAVAQRSFIDLYNKKLMVRVEDPVMWCTKCQTAIAQADLDDVEKQSQFNTIKFKYKQDDSDILIMTTRPELIPACVALFVHPEDERFKSYVGHKAIVPLTSQEVPIVADESVDPEKGTGFMMVCTWGDAEDVDKWKRYSLDTRCVIDEKGHMNELAGKYKGLYINKARKAMLEDLEEQGLLVKQEQITHVTNVHERCKTPLEFYKTPQWFIKVLEHKDQLLDQVEKVNWYPTHMKVRMRHWVENLKWDWCISRQRFYGVPFPVWYCNNCHEVVLASDDELPVNPMESTTKNTCSCDNCDLRPEEDVMDTWMTSSMTPQVAFKWGEKDSLMKNFPMSLRPQAHDIIRTWAFYTLVKAFYHEKTIPWTDIMVSGHGQDPKGRKMSKSLGNVVTMKEVIDKYSADAFRYWSSSVTLGDDLPFQEKDVATGQKTVNKLWNATKFTFLQLEDFNSKDAPELLPVDQWLLHELAKTIKTSTENFDAYAYSKSRAVVDNFFWKTFCDNYLEIIKDRVYNPDTRGEAGRKSAQYALYTALLAIIKMYSPFMPHITEELYQLFFRKHEETVSIHKAAWPALNEADLEFPLAKIGETLLYAVESARKAKSERNVSLKTEIISYKLKAKLNDVEFDMIKDDLKAAANIKELTFEPLDEKSEFDYTHDLLIE